MSPNLPPTARRRGVRWALALAATLLLAPSAAPAQSITTLSGSPAAQESLEPVVGFRTYDSLLARHEELFLANDHVQQTLVGMSFAMRPIYAYRITSESDRAPDGARKSPMMFQGLIHAREWIAGEVTTQVLEKLILDYGTDPIATYLVDQVDFVCVPVHNPDGFLQTQRYFNQTVSGGFGGGDDGRLRRKNMKDSDGSQVDEILSTFDDYLEGVDLNRNHEYGWPNSNSPTSINYSGTAPGSEPESQAMYAAAALMGDASRIRAWIDFHSYGEDIYYIRTGASNRDAYAQQLASRMSSVYQAIGGNGYTLLPVNPGEEIGATDEFFSHEYGALGMTVELPSGGGATGGFVMPNNEVAAAVAENLEASFLCFYYAAGPPSAERVVFWQDANMNGLIDAPGEVAYDGYWTADAAGAARALTVGGSGVRPGEAYNVWVTTNKPLRRDLAGNGVPAKWPGLTAPADPSVLLSVPLMSGGNASVPTSSATYLGAAATGYSPGGSLDGATPGYQRYKFDSWRATVTIPASAALGGSIGVDIRAADMYGHLLDGRPQTVADWGPSGWLAYENGTNGANGFGGPDLSHSVSIVATIEPTIEFASATSSVSESGLAQIEVKLSEAAGAAGVSVDFAVVGGTAGEPADFSVSNGGNTLTYLEGEDAAFIELALVSDLLDEADETVVIELSNPTGFVLGTSTTHTVTIVDSNVPVVSFDVAASSAAESDDTPATIAVSLDIAAGPAGVAVPYSVSKGGTAGSSDFLFGGASPLMIPAGGSSALISLTAFEDGVDEEDETIAIALSGDVSATPSSGDPFIFTILDGDPAPEVSFSAATGSVDETAGTHMVQVVLSAASGRPAGVDVEFQVNAGNSTAVEGEDFSIAAISGPVFAEGVATYMLAISILDDGAFEEDETVEIELVNPTNAAIGSANLHTLTIASDDPPPPPDGIIAR